MKESPGHGDRGNGCVGIAPGLPHTLRAALNISGPTYAHEILTTAGLVAAIKTERSLFLSHGE